MMRIKRLVSVILVLMMMLQTLSFAVPTQNKLIASKGVITSQFVDFPQNWAKDAMTAAVQNEIMHGTSQTTIEPDKYLTRAEFAAIIARAFGATVEKAELTFTDVSKDDWFYSSVAKAVQMGAMEGTSTTTFDPNDNIRREDMFLTIARILFVSDKDTDVLDKFSDKKLVDTWAKEQICGLVKNGYVNGYEDDTLRPRNSITRAEAAQVFYNLFGAYISEGGTYSDITEEKSLVIRSKDVKLTNSVIYGDLILADGIGAGDCVLENVDVKGRIIVRGGEGTVTFTNVTAEGQVIINDPNGVVNFHNYRTDVPFYLNLIENTPATFLERSSGGMSGGGAPAVMVDYTVEYWFEKTDGSGVFEENATLRVTDDARKGTRVNAPALDDADIPEGYVEDFAHPDRKVTENSVQDGDVLKRYYKLKTYDVTFKNYDGTTYAKVEDVKHGQTIHPSDIPADLGDTTSHRFDGWSKDGTLANKVDLATLLITGNLTLKPIKTEKDKVNYTTKFYFQNTDLTTYTEDTTFAKQDSNYPDVMVSPHTITVPQGFVENTGLASPSTALYDGLVLSRYYDRKEYTVTFKKANGTTYATAKAKYGCTISASDIPSDLADTATQTFKGWSTDGTLANKVDFATFTVEGNITLKPIFVEKDKVSYVTKFYFQNTDLTTYTEDASLEKEGADYPGVMVNAATITVPQGFVENTGLASPSTALYDGLVLSRYYDRKEYTVTFKKANGTTYATAKAKYGCTISASDIPSDLADTATQAFKGWSTDGTLANKVDFATFVVEGNVTLKPIFVDKTKVTYTTKFYFQNTDLTTYTEDTTFAKQDSNYPDVMVSPHTITVPYGFVENTGLASPSTALYDGLVLSRYYDRAEYTVTFKNIDNSTYATASAKYGCTISVSDIPSDLADTATQIFLGWSIDGTNLVDLTTYAILEETVLVPVFIDKVPVKVRFLDNTLIDPDNPDPDDAIVEEFEIITGTELTDADLPDSYDYYEEGFYRDPSWSDAYVSLSAEELKHIINYNWWYQKDGEWVQYEDGLVITQDTDFFYKIKQVTVDIRVERVDYPLTLAAPYESDTRALDTLKDLIFMNEDIISTAFDAVGIEKKVLEKLAEKDLIDPLTREIKNINEMRTFSSLLGRATFESFLNERLKHFYEPGEDDETIESFLINYIRTHSEDSVVTDITPLINHLIANDHTASTDMLYNAVAQIVKTNPDLVLTYLKAYVTTAKGDSGKLASLKADLNSAFVSFRDDHPTEFINYIKQEIKELLSADNADIISLVTDHVVQSIKNGSYSDELKATVSAMTDDDLENLVISVINADYSVVKTELEAELSNPNNTLFNAVIDSLRDATSNKDQIDAKIIDLLFDAISDPAVTKDDLREALESDRNDFYEEVKTELGATATAKTGAIDYITQLFADSSYASIKNNAVSEYLDIVFADADDKADLIDKAVKKVTNPNVANVLNSVISDTVSDIISNVGSDDSFVDSYCASIKNNSDFYFIIDIVLATDENTTNNIISDLFDHFLAMGRDGEILIEQIIDKFVDKMIETDTIDEELVRIAIRFIRTDSVNGPVLIEDLVDNLMHVENILDFAEDLGFIDATDGRLKASLDFIRQITNNQTYDISPDNLFIIEELLGYIKELEYEDFCKTYIKPRVPAQIYSRLKPLLDDFLKDIYTRTLNAYIAQVEDAVEAAKTSGITTAVDSGVTIQINFVSEILIPMYDQLMKLYDKADEKAQGSTGKLGELYNKFYVDNPYIDDIISLTSPDKWFFGSANDYTHEFSGYTLSEFEDWYENLKALVVLSDDLFVWYCNNVDYEDVENAITSQEDRILNYANLVNQLLTDFSENGIPDSIEDIYNTLMDNEMFANDLTNADGKVPVDVQAYIERFATNATIGAAYAKVLGRFGIRVESLIDIVASSRLNKTYTSDDIAKALEKIEFGMQDGNKNYTTDYVFDKVIGDDFASVDARGNSIEIERGLKDSYLGD